MSSSSSRSVPPSAALSQHRETLPTMYDLPSEFPEESGLPDEFHDLQPQLLSRTLSLANYRRDRWFTGTDLNVYYNAEQPLWHKRPDWFLALDVPRLYDDRDMRLSYVVWQEGQSPHVVVEFLSPSTEREDLGRFYRESDRVIDTTRQRQPTLPPAITQPPQKLEVYETHLQVPHYVVYNRYTQRLRYFHLSEGRYQEQPLRADEPPIWFADLEVGLGIWHGEFEGITSHWLRWCDAAGNWFLTDTETERAAREQAQQRAEILAERLRSLGINPDEL